MQQALLAIILQALCRLRGAVLFHSVGPSLSWGCPFWVLGLTRQSSRPAYGGRLTSPVSLKKPLMPRHQWNSLNTQQIGAYAEYFVKMELTMHGFQVYSTEVDDRGIDFVARRESGPFIEVQVKSLRSMGYVFMQKTKFPLRPHTYLALCLFADGQEPKLFLIPSVAWLTPNAIFVDRKYDAQGQTSKPEWGLNVSKRNMAALSPYSFESTIKNFAVQIDG